MVNPVLQLTYRQTETHNITERPNNFDVVPADPSMRIHDSATRTTKTTTDNDKQNNIVLFFNNMITLYRYNESILI